jgi:hypothetical protein
MVLGVFGLPLGCMLALPIITVADAQTNGLLAVVCGVGLAVWVVVGCIRLLSRRTTRF